MTTDNLQSTFDCIERALGAIAARVLHSPAAAVSTEVDPRSLRAVAVAYSGGLDSSVLLHRVQAAGAAHGWKVHAFHVHHGLSPQADAWLAHCAAQASALGVRFDSRRIEVDAGAGGIEGAARLGRYAALGAMCRAHDVPLLLTAHHQDDQAETVLLQLLRGSGVAGLSGMDQVNQAPALLGDPDLFMGRPLLSLSRAELEEIAAAHAIVHVEDASNADPRYARNALRHQVMPLLAAQFPGFVQRFARSARHAQSAQRLLVELATQDLAACIGIEGGGDSLDLDVLQSLSSERIDNLLRYWFGLRGVRMPSTAWLQEMRSQLQNAKPDAQLLVRHADCDIHRHRNRVVMTTRRDGSGEAAQAVSFAWTGDAEMAFPAFGGTLHFEPAEIGVDAHWLQQQHLTLQWRSGGWQLKLAPNRPTRSLKYHYQAADIPAWERSRLPLVTVGPSRATAPVKRPGVEPATRLLYAAGLGMDCHHFATGSGQPIALRWQDDLR